MKNYNNISNFVNNDIGLPGGHCCGKCTVQPNSTLPTAVPPVDYLYRGDVSTACRVEELENSNRILQETVKFLLSKLN
jgi:hypothetical protein